MAQTQNILAMTGIDFVEFSTKDPDDLRRIFFDFGFSLIARHKSKDIEVYTQEDIVFLLNFDHSGFGFSFQKTHGPSISSMGWKFKDARKAHSLALSRGAKDAGAKDYQWLGSPIPTVFGIGDSLIYFTERKTGEPFPFEAYGFQKLQDPVMVKSKGFLTIDHLTNNVFKGTMEQWAQFYKKIFEFEEVRHFDIRGKKTGLTSYALRSPCGSFCIPINEADEAKSQINEYLEEYHGPGVQHLAFLTKDLLASLKALEGSKINTLDIESSYYQTAFKRVPRMKEDKATVQKYNVLVDGDEDGYLLQIFTKNLVGPIFIELIQRENHQSFGEGNFQALFDSIERDQMKRGVL